MDRFPLCKLQLRFTPTAPGLLQLYFLDAEADNHITAKNELLEESADQCIVKAKHSYVYEYLLRRTHDFQTMDYGEATVFTPCLE